VVRGGCVFLFGLYLLVAAGGPPFGGHGLQYFVRTEFEGRAGIVGEALYAAFHSFSGMLGVALIGWVAAVLGLSLATGMTLRRFASHTKAAAQSVKQAAVSWRERSSPVSYLDDWASGEQPPGGQSALAGPSLGPVDLVEGAAAGDISWQATAAPGPFAGEFEDWGAPGKEQGGVGRGASTTVTLSRPGGVIDGARAFEDLYAGPGRREGSVGPVSHAGGSQSAATAGRPEQVAPGRSGGDHESGQRVASAPASEIAAGGGRPEGEGVARQEPLPGLEQAAGRLDLPPSGPVYVMPAADWLRKSPPQSLAEGTAGRDKAAAILRTLSQFGVEARVIGMVVGPRVTRYELQLAPGIKVAKVASLKDDLAYALATTGIRILTPVPGKTAVGVELPNDHEDFVTLGDIYRDFPRSAGPLMVWLGKDISGKAVYTDLTELPHLLIAGTTGSGKSACVNCIVSSILLRATPEQVRFVMIDPKKVELSHYDRIPHLLVPVVTNMKEAAGVLHNLIQEMEDRYDLMELEHARSLADLNKARARRGERSLPYIVVVIDELADLMMVSPQEVEDYVIRLAQKSRAVGIHLVVATQRPSADVITGMIKANIPSRIAFYVSSQIDSRVILDMNGAESLLGKGDMLFKPLGSSQLQRIQGAYIAEEEIAVLVRHWRRQAEPEFREELLRLPPDPKELKRAEEEFYDPDSDDLLAEAAQLVIETGSASVSMLQRRLRVGYTRAGRLIDMLERRGIVGPWEGSKPRQILVEPDEVESVLALLRAESRGGAREDRTYGD
jgi:S-DNA-T family DNA segregation ATPase FtsK/SpoIIIE